jgi:hypothetical protein
MNPIFASIEHFLRKLADDALRQLDGVSQEDLNTWRPREHLHDVNTFYALGTHLVGSGEFWVLHAAGGRPLNRDRPAEFRAQGRLDDLRARYDHWLAECHAVLSGLTPEDLGRVVDLPEWEDDTWTVGACLIHAVEHTATHVGHLHIQRQLWDAEQAPSAANAGVSAG